MGIRLASCLAIAATAVACAAPAEGEGRLGTERSAIIDGRVSTSREDAVVLLARADDGRFVPSCTGTLVAPNLVLTARHCVGHYNDDHTVDDGDATALAVYFGSDAPLLAANRGRPAARGRALVVPTTSSLVPDVAFVVLDAAIGGPVATVRLAGGAEAGEPLTVVGFGIGRDGAASRKRTERDVTVSGVGPSKAAHDTLFAGEFAVGEAACSGDSGGPAFSTKTGALVGVASRVGNGLVRDDDDPSAFCVGADTTDVYSSLAEVSELVDRAFAAAGAAPRVELRTLGAATGPIAADADATSDDSAGGCAAAGKTKSAPSLPGGALLGVAFVLLRRRARASRAR